MKLLQSFIILSVLLSSLTFADDTEDSTVEASGDFCYTEPITSGVSIIKGHVSIFYSTTTPINNISGQDITDMTIIKSFDGVDISVMSTIKIDDINKTTSADSDEAEINTGVQAAYADMNMGAGVDSEIVYRISEFDTGTSHTIYDGSKSSMGNSTTHINATYTKDGVKYYSEITPCDIPSSSTQQTGPFDAWNTDSNITARDLKTKVVSSDFNLKINSMDASNSATVVKQGIDMEYRLYDLNTSVAITDWKSYDASAHKEGESETEPFTDIETAYKDVRVQFKICTTTNRDGSTELHSLSYCEYHNLDYNTSTYSTDNFAIRPYSFAAFGKNQYKRAGEDFNITIKAVNSDNADKLGNSDNEGDDEDSVDSLTGYNAKLSDLTVVAQYFTPSDDDIDQMKDDTGKDDVTTCSNSGTFTITNSTDTFDDGTINAHFNFDETGILDIKISETAGKEWALVDSDDTSDDQRYIQASTITYDKENISANIIMLFVPYKFDTTATYDNTATGKDWLYINDINKSNSTFTTPQHAAYITYQIVAKNKAGDTTKNYTKTCFPDVSEVNCPRVNGLKLNTTFDLFLDANIISSKESNISLYVEDNSSNAIWTPTKNLTLQEENNSIRQWISPFEFTDGVGVAKVYFNINRKISKPINPTVITVHDANTSTSWMSNSGSPKEFNGNTLDSNKTFYYGRTHAKRQRFTGSTGDSFINYEVYCSGTGCDKALLQDGVKSAISDDPRWFINSHHVTSKDGIVSNITQKGGANLVTSTEDSAAPTKATLTYSGSSFPYKVTMEADVPAWLLYNKYNSSATKDEFEVEFTDSNSSWAGKRETNTTTNTTATKRTNRRSMW